MSDESTTDRDETGELTASAADRDPGMRHALAQALGQQIGGDDDLYDVFNWDKDPDVEDYYAAYTRNPYAGPVVEAVVNLTWRDPPDIEDKEDAGVDTDTTFEQGVEQLADDLRLWNYCKRADVLAGIGEFGLLVLELSDTSTPADFGKPVESADELEGLRPFSQLSILEIEKGGPASGRWGEPVRYKLDLSDEDDATDSTEGPSELWVHHSRVIHIPSDGLLDDEVRGQPRLEPVWNVLTDIEKTLGSSAELAYRASAWGLAVNIAKDFDLEDGGDDLDERLKRWYYGLEPILRTQGADSVESLGGEDIDPGPVIDPQVEALSARTGLPQSVLKGNETGERATSQDLKELYGKGSERREQFNTPIIVREILDRLIRFGALDPPQGDGYDVIWSPLAETSEADIAAIQLDRSNTAKNLAPVMPSFGTAEWAEYVDTGEFPEVPDEADLEAPIQPATAADLQPDGQPAVADGGEDVDDEDETEG